MNRPLVHVVPRVGWLRFELVVAARFEAVAPEVARQRDGHATEVCFTHAIALAPEVGCDPVWPFPNPFRWRHFLAYLERTTLRPALGVLRLTWDPWAALRDLPRLVTFVVPHTVLICTLHVGPDAVVTHANLLEVMRRTPNLRPGARCLVIGWDQTH